MFQKSDAKIEITITATNLIRIKYRFSSFNYRLLVQTLHISTKSTAQFLSIKWNSKIEVSSMEESP